MLSRLLYLSSRSQLHGVSRRPDSSAWRWGRGWSIRFYCRGWRRRKQSQLPAPKAYNDRAPETSYTGGENGHKIAFDPRDISESEERSKQPKLTLMEEVLLMGLKDKQVQLAVLSRLRIDTDFDCVQGLFVILERQHLLRATRMHSH